MNKPVVQLCALCWLFLLHTFSVHEHRAVNEMMLNNFVERGRPQLETWNKRIECWVTKATNTHSYHVM
jgi:hypothetical protein